MHKRLTIKLCKNCGTQIAGYRTYNYLGNGESQFKYCPECGKPCKEQEESNEEKEE